MDDIGEIGQRILSELEEAWEENVYTLINTVFYPYENSDLEGYCDAVRSLYARGLVRITMRKWRVYLSMELPESAEREVLQSLEEWFALDEEGDWTYSKGDIREAAIPQLLATEAGHEMAERLLETRGYKWWRNGKE